MTQKKKYEERVTQVTVAPAGEPIYSELVTTVAIDDEAAGEFVAVSQEHAEGNARILIDPGEWPSLRSSINKMLRRCRE